MIGRLGRTLSFYGDLQRLVHEILVKACRIQKATRILEIGCGSGSVLSRLTEFSNSVYGIDVSYSAVKMSRKMVTGVSVADAGLLPFADCSFDLVYSTGVVDLFGDEDAAAILKEVARVTCSGGSIVAVTAWKGCILHEAVKRYLIGKSRWRYGPKRTFGSLAPLLPVSIESIRERRMGAIFQFRFISYLFEEYAPVRIFYHSLFLVLSILLWPLNRLPGALLVTMLEKK